jgi:hypothetical protein
MKTIVKTIEYRGIEGFDVFTESNERHNKPYSFILKKGEEVLIFTEEVFPRQLMYLEDDFKKVVDDYLDKGLLPEGTQWDEMTPVIRVIWAMRKCTQEGGYLD